LSRRRSLGKGPLAATHLLAAQETVEQQLTSLKINLEVRLCNPGCEIHSRMAGRKIKRRLRSNAGQLHVRACNSPPPPHHPFLALQATEAELGMQAIWQGRIYCHLRVLAAEQQVLQALGASRFAQVGRGTRLGLFHWL